MTTMATRRESVPARPVAALVPLIRKELDAGTDHYREAGKLLLEAKALQHRTFKRWVEDTFPVSYMQASRYMRMAAAKSHTRVTFRKLEGDPTTRRKAHTQREATPAESRQVRDMACLVIQTGFKALVPRYHPDRPGGSAEQMTRLNQVRDMLLTQVNAWTIRLPH